MPLVESSDRNEAVLRVGGVGAVRKIPDKSILSGELGSEGRCLLGNLINRPLITDLLNC